MMVFKYVYQPTCYTLDMKKANYEYKVWKSKEICNSELRPLHSLTPIIKYFGEKIGLQFKVAFQLWNKTTAQPNL